MLKNTRYACVIAALAGLAFLSSPLRAANEPKALLLTGDGNRLDHGFPYPPWYHEFQNDKVVEILDGIVDITITEDLSDLNDRNLRRYDLLINNSIALIPAQEQLDAFYRYVAGGGKYLAMHSGLLSLMDSKERKQLEHYERLIGGRVVGGPANEPEEFTVYPYDPWWGYEYLYSDDPAYAHDGDPRTRWSSDYIDPSWITIDLGTSRRVSRVELSWDGAYAKQYRIQTSNDLDQWTTVYTENNGDGEGDRIRFEPVEARYVRMYGTERAIDWGYSLYEFEIYGNAVD